LSSKSSAVLLCTNAINNDGHEAVVNTTKLATLTVKGTGAVNIKADLVKAAGTAIHFYTKGGDSSAVQDVRCSKKNANLGADR